MARKVLIVAGCVCAVLLSQVRALADGPGGVGDPYVWARVDTPGASNENDDASEVTVSALSPFSWALGTGGWCHADIGPVTTGLAQAKCTLTAHDKLGYGLACGADVETYKPFLITSASLPVGSQVEVNMAILYEGTLNVNEGVTGLQSWAHASCHAELKTTGDFSLVSRLGDATVTGTGGSGTMLDVSGAWQGHWTGDGPYSVSYTDTLTFTGAVGTSYWLYLDLATDVHSGAGGNSTYYTTLASANFYDTGTYTLSSPADVQFQVTPEPATLMLLGMGGAVLVSRRRRAA